MQRRLSNLKLKMFVNPEKPHQQCPELKCKGAECKWLTKIFKVLSQVLHDGTEKSEHIQRMFQGICNFQDVVDTSPCVPTDVQAAKAAESMKQFLTHYQHLHHAAEANDDLNWHVVTKRHMAYHLSENFRFMNCKFNWCFKPEDFVGRVSVLAHSVYFGVRSTNMTTKLMEKYRMLMFIKFARGQSETED